MAHLIRKKIPTTKNGEHIYKESKKEIKRVKGN